MARPTAGLLIAVTVALAGLGAGTAQAGFSGTDVFVASVGRSAGAGGSDWSTTVWVYNPNPTPANIQFSFLLRDRDNSAPQLFNDVVQPGDTVRYDNAVGTMFAAEGFGALRIRCSQRIVVNSRIYSQAPGASPRDSTGQFFAGIPAGFAIGAGQSTEILGAYQTDPKAESEFRTNFGFVETSGKPVDLTVTARDPSGAILGSKPYNLKPFEPRQLPLDDLAPGIDAANVRLDVAVTGGEGRVIAFASGIANRSNDPFTSEMQFADALLAENASFAVQHDASLRGDGSTGSPLGVADGAVVRTLNGVADAVAIEGGPGVTVGTAGQTITIAQESAPVCPGCSAGAVFRATVSVRRKDIAAFTVPPGKTRYVTGIYPATTCSDVGGYVDVSINGALVVTLFPGNPPWMSGGGAPLVVQEGESLSFIAASTPVCESFVTVTGFEL